MAEERTRSLLLPLLLVGSLLAAALAVSFAPLAQCPNCEGSASAWREINSAWLADHPDDRRDKTCGFSTHRPCARCSFSGRVSFLNKLRWPRPEAPAYLDPPFEVREIGP